MQQHIYYIRFALRFADMQIPELVTILNAQVQNRGWSSMRAYHDQALIDEFQRRGIDTTSVYDGKTIQQASTRSSSVHLLYLFLKQLSIVLYLIKAFLFAGIVYFFIR